MKKLSRQVGICHHRNYHRSLDSSEIAIETDFLSLVEQHVSKQEQNGIRKRRVIGIRTKMSRTKRIGKSVKPILH